MSLVQAGALFGASAPDEVRAEAAEVQQILATVTGSRDPRSVRDVQHVDLSIWTVLGGKLRED